MTMPSLLRDRNFLNFWSAQAISQFGTQLGRLAFPILAVSLLGASAFQVGVLNASATAAFLLVGLPAGAWVDRWMKRRVMITADLVRMVAMAAVPLLWWADVLAIWHLYVVAGVVGVATVFFDVSYQSIVPILVRREQVSDANSKLEATAQLARMGGPALGGGLLQVLSVPVLFVFETAGYLWSAVFLWRTRDQEEPHRVEDRQRLAKEIAEGLRFVVRHPLLIRIAACTALANFSANLMFTLLPILVLRHLELGAAGLAAAMSMGAVGGLLGAIATPWIAKRVGEGTIIPVAALLQAPAAALIPLSVIAGSDWLALAFLVAAEFGISFSALAYNIMQVSMRQRVCPPRLLGRMNASIRFLVWGVIPLSALLSGYLGGAIGVVPTMWISVAGGLLAAVPVLFSPLTGMRTLPDSQQPESLQDVEEQEAGPR
ncbi:MAG TPA: MFS transporter [Arthrobacter sp.]|nr:MFS transporter [Arthrobacter sp.]